MSFNNRNNLPNPSAPWGREVETKIEQLERENSQGILRDANNNRSLTGSLSVIAQQQRELALALGSIIHFETDSKQGTTEFTTGGTGSGTAMPSMSFVVPPEYTNLYFLWVFNGFENTNSVRIATVEWGPFINGNPLYARAFSGTSFSLAGNGSGSETVQPGDTFSINTSAYLVPGSGPSATVSWNASFIALLTK